MKSSLLAIVLASGVLMGASFVVSTSRAEYPKPSQYPVSWELKFEHDLPQRIVVKVPNAAAPQAYWYMTYTITNNSGQEQMFLPTFDLLTNDGRLIRSDNRIPATVFSAIKSREKRTLLEPWTKIGGELLIGPDQAKDGVAIWPEPMLRMEHFSIFVGGLSGEAVRLKDEAGTEVKDKDGKPVILRKTLQLNFHIRGDDVYPGEDEINENAENWVMR